MTVTSRRERRQQQRRQEQRRASSGGGSKPRGGGISQLWIIAGVVVLVVALILIGRAAGVFEPPVASNVNPNDAQMASWGTPAAVRRPTTRARSDSTTAATR